MIENCFVIYARQLGYFNSLDPEEVDWSRMGYCLGIIACWPFWNTEWDDNKEENRQVE